MTNSSREEVLRNQIFFLYFVTFITTTHATLMFSRDLKFNLKADIAIRLCVAGSLYENIKLLKSAVEISKPFDRQWGNSLAFRRSFQLPSYCRCCVVVALSCILDHEKKICLTRASVFVSWLIYQPVH